MNQPVFRPASVWITQIILVLALIGWVSARLVSPLFRCFSVEPFLRCTSLLTNYEFLTEFLTLIPAFLAVWGLQKRQRYGQWLSVSLLLGAMITFIADQQTLHRALQLIYQSIIHSQPLPNPLNECNHPFGDLTYFCGYKSYQALVFKIVLDALPSLILGFLAVRLLYSQAAKRFFHK